MKAREKKKIFGEAKRRCQIGAGNGWGYSVFDWRDAHQNKTKRTGERKVKRRES